MAKKKNNNILEELKNISMQEGTVNNETELFSSTSTGNEENTESLSNIKEIEETSINEEFKENIVDSDVKLNESENNNEEGEAVENKSEETVIDEAIENKSEEKVTDNTDKTLKKQIKRTKEYIHYNEMMGYLWNGQNY